MTSQVISTLEPNEGPYRVLAWWDVDMHIGAYRKHKLTARPLRNLENVLGHRIHGTGHSRHSQMRDGVWKFEAFNYIDVADSALAAYFVLKQVSRLSDWFWGFGYRTVTSLSDDFDQDTICTFYWNDHDSPPTYRQIESGGVLLALVDKPTRLDRRDFRYDFHRIGARPIVRPIWETPAPTNFLATMTIHYTCTNRQKLVEHHWPKLMEKYGLGSDVTVDFGAQPKDGERNQITVLKTLPKMFEHDAVAYALARTERCRFRLGAADEDFFLAESFPDHPPADGMFSITLNRTA